MTWTDFNINCMVRVRLTDLGRQIHAQRHLDLEKRAGRRFRYTTPPVDADGWSRFQMHDLMSTFGEHVGMCRDLPFETTIQVEAPGD